MILFQVGHNASSSILILYISMTSFSPKEERKYKMYEFKIMQRDHVKLETNVPQIETVFEVRNGLKLFAFVYKEFHNLD